jgi:hypothetical protein
MQVTVLVDQLSDPRLLFTGGWCYLEGVWRRSTNITSRSPAAPIGWVPSCGGHWITAPQWERSRRSLPDGLRSTCAGP